MSLSVQEEQARKRRFWKKQIEAWQSSRLEQTVFCRQHNLKYHRFTYWRKKLIPRIQSLVCLVQVPLAQTISPQVSLRSLRLVTESGYRIEVERDFDPVALKQLRHVLERP